MREIRMPLLACWRLLEGSAVKAGNWSLLNLIEKGNIGGFARSLVSPCPSYPRDQGFCPR
jgi:hypothetical protein